MELSETLFQFFNIGLVGIVRDGHRFGLQVRIELFQPFLETDIAVYLFTQFSHVICDTLNTTVRRSLATTVVALSNTAARAMQIFLVFMMFSFN